MKLEPFLRNRVAKRMFFVFVACALIPVLAVAGLYFYRTSRVLREQAFARLRTANKSYSVALHGRILDAEQELVAVSSRAVDGYVATGRELAWVEIRPEAPEDEAVRAHLDAGMSALVIDPTADHPVVMWRVMPGHGYVAAAVRDEFLWGPVEALPGSEIAATSGGGALFSSIALPPSVVRSWSQLSESHAVGDVEWRSADVLYLASYRWLFLKPQFAHPGLLVVASQNDTEALAPLRAFQSVFPPAILLAVMVAALLSITQLRRRTVPLEKILDGTREIGRGDFSTRVDVRSGDEFELLATSLNDMAVQLQTLDAERERQEMIARERQEQLIQADKMASLGVLVSGVAHEVNNPNSLIRLNAELLKDVWSDVDAVLVRHREETGDFRLGPMMYSELAQEIPTLLEDSLQGTERIARIVADLKDFARQKPPEMSGDVDLNGVCRSAVHLLRRAIDKHTDRFEEAYDSNPQTVRGDFQRLEQVVMNLLINACEALTDRSKGLTLSTEAVQDDDAVCVRVVDEGVGISSEALPRLMDPFFTTKRSSGGTGLGLSICATIVREHRGRLRFAPREGGGTVAELTLPRETTP